MPTAAPPCPFEKRFPSSMLRDDEFFMWHAYNLSLEAWRKDEVPVGAVIESEGQIIASAHNQVESLRDPTAHAEILAITQAAASLDDWRLTGCTLYVTKEPCPLCAGATIMSRLTRIVYAIADDKQGCLGGALELHMQPTFQHHPIVTPGILEKECLSVFQKFFQLKREQSSTESAKTDKTPPQWN